MSTVKIFDLHAAQAERSHDESGITDLTANEPNLVYGGLRQIPPFKFDQWRDRMRMPFPRSPIDVPRLPGRVRMRY